MGQLDSSSLSGGHTGGVIEPEESPSQMPLNMMNGLGDVPEFSDASFAPPRKTLSSGLMLLLSVVALAGAVLYAMRVSGRVEATDANLATVERQIDQALSRLQGNDPKASAKAREDMELLFKDTDQVVAMFASDPNKKQVGLDNLAKNPFELYVSASAKPAEAKSADQIALEKARLARLAALRKELDALQVQSVLNGGGTNLAVISGKVVREGDAIGSFTVTGIGGTGVRLSAEGNSYTLQMQQPGGDKNSK